MNINYDLTDGHQQLRWIDVKKIIVSGALACFVISLFQTSLFTSGDDIRGYWILFIGWFGLLFFQFAWFANPLNLLALLLLRQKPKISLALSLVAFLLAMQSFYFSEIPIGLDHEKIYIKELGIGFYFWFLAQGLFLVSIFLELIIKCKNE